MASSSSPSWSGRGGAGYDGQGSPVPYRVPPLGYEPSEYCSCERKACRWISWSNGQPGCRYYRCNESRYKRDCGYFKWLDEETSEWYKELLRDLRDMVWRLKKQVKEDVAVNACGTAMVDEIGQMNQVLQEQLLKKDAELQAKNAELEAKVEELEAMKAMVKKQNGWPRFLCCLSFSD